MKLIYIIKVNKELIYFRFYNVDDVDNTDPLFAEYNIVSFPSSNNI